MMRNLSRNVRLVRAVFMLYVVIGFNFVIKWIMALWRMVLFNIRFVDDHYLSDKSTNRKKTTCEGFNVILVVNEYDVKQTKSISNKLNKFVVFKEYLHLYHQLKAWHANMYSFFML